MNPVCKWAHLHLTERCEKCPSMAPWWQQACEDDQTCWLAEKSAVEAEP